MAQAAEEDKKKAEMSKGEQLWHWIKDKSYEAGVWVLYISGYLIIASIIITVVWTIGEFVWKHVGSFMYEEIVNFGGRADG